MQIDASGQMCAGKAIHGVLDSSSVALKFHRECWLLSQLDHPNIVKFLGVCYLPELSPAPILLMEKLEQTLHGFLEETLDIALAIKVSILADIASGLVYLHVQNPPIIHRNLTAKTVRLTEDLKAKIADFGKSRKLEAERSLTPIPGASVYMPPETSQTNGPYGLSVDIFSFGHLVLFVGLQVSNEHELLPMYVFKLNYVPGNILHKINYRGFHGTFFLQRLTMTTQL